MVARNIRSVICLSVAMTALTGSFPGYCAGETLSLFAIAEVQQTVEVEEVVEEEQPTEFPDDQEVVGADGEVIDEGAQPQFRVVQISEIDSQHWTRCDVSSAPIGFEPAD